MCCLQAARRLRRGVGQIEWRAKGGNKNRQRRVAAMLEARFVARARRTIGGNVDFLQASAGAHHDFNLLASRMRQQNLECGAERKPQRCKQTQRERAALANELGLKCHLR